MPSTLTEKAASSVGWSSVGTALRLGFQFVFSIAMARLLAPSDFGVMAIISLINGVSVSLADAGFNQALIQRELPTDKETSSVFYLQILIATCLMLLIMASASSIASFFEMPILASVALVLSIEAVLSAFRTVQFALLVKEMQFKRLTLIQAGASVLAGILAIALAYNEWGVWSLVAFSIANSTLLTLGFWLASRWRPKLMFSLVSLKPLFRFGSYIMLIGLFEAVFSRINSIFIGKYYTAKELGLYSRAESTVSLPNNFLSGTFNLAGFALFSVAIADPPRLLAGFQKAVRIGFYLQVPAMVGIAMAADSIIIALYGPKWSDSIIYLRAFAIANIFWLPRLMNISLLKAIGRSREYLGTELFQKIAFLVAAIITFRFGILAMVWGLAFVNALTYFLTARIAGDKMGYMGISQVQDSARCLIAALLMALLMGSMNFLPQIPAMTLLVFQIIVGGGSYLIFCYIFRVSEQSIVLQHGRSFVLGKLGMITQNS